MQFEANINSRVGLVVPHSLKKLVADKSSNINVSERDDMLEYQYTYYDGCSIVYVIEKSSFIVKSWRYASTKELCSKRKYGPW